MPRRALPALLLVLVVSALPAQGQLPTTPGAGASEARISMELQDPGLPLVPARPYSLTLLVHYQYGPGGNVPPEQDIAPNGRVCGTVTVTNPPPWATVKVIPPDVCFVINPSFSVGGTTVDNSTIVEVNVTEDAPALTPYNLTIRAETPARGSLRNASGEVSRLITSGFVGRLRVEAPRDAVVRGGTDGQVPVRLINDGNGPIEVRFRNASGPQGVRVHLPQRLVLENPGDVVVVAVGVEAPWTTPVRGLVQFDIESAHPSRPDLMGDTPKVRFDVQGKAAVPGPGLGGALLALAALAFARPRA